jgi:hypothetical protein
MHLALAPIALCPSGEDRIELQKAGIGSPKPFPRFVSLAYKWLMAEHLRISRRWQLRGDCALPAITEHRGTCEAKEYFQ